MLTKEQFLEAVSRETAILKHLYGKIPPGGMDFCPGAGMRTTRELLRYLTACGIVPARCLVSGDWSRAGPMLAERQAMKVEEFPLRADEQLGMLRDLVGGLAQEDLERRIVRLPWGEEQRLGAALVNTTLRFLTAYRMQLFLHAKAAGARELSTRNCWLGEDPPRAS